MSFWDFHNKIVKHMTSLTMASTCILLAKKIICAIVNHSCERILFIGSISLDKMQDHNIRQLCYPNGPGGGICCSTNTIWAFEW